MNRIEEEKFLEGKTNILLDLDGTLVNSVEAHARSWCEVFHKLGYPEIALPEVQRLIGMGGDKLIGRAIGVTEEQEVERIENERSELFRDKFLRDVYPFPGADQLINQLRARGLKVMIATASSPVDRDALLQRGGLENHFHEFVSPDDLEGSKPDPDLLQAIMARLKVAPRSCLFVGDSPYDARAAYSAGVDFVGVESGCYGRQELPHAVEVFPSVAEFADLLERVKAEA